MLSRQYSRSGGVGRSVGCFLKGAAVGAAIAVGVGLLAAGAVGAGVVSAPVASGALLAVGAVGGAGALYQGYNQGSNGN